VAEKGIGQTEVEDLWSSSCELFSFVTEVAIPYEKTCDSSSYYMPQA
jgi:hypothetical protein